MSDTTPPDGEPSWTPPAAAPPPDGEPTWTPPAAAPPPAAAQPPSGPPPGYQPPPPTVPPPSGPPSGYQPPAGPPPGYQPPPPTVPPPSGPPPAYGYPATYPTRSQSPGPAQYPAQPAYPSQAQYPGPPEYPGQPRYPLPLASVTGPGQLRSRALHRPSPRFGVTLAAAGVGLAVLGALIISIDQFTSGAAELFDGGDGGGNKTPGILICLVVVLLGYGLAAQGRTGPLGAAGVLATIIGLPALLGFIFFDVHNGEDPFNLTGVLALTVVGFVLAYLLGPTRGHPAYLAGAAIAFWLFILNQVQSLTAAPASAISSQISGDPTEGPNLTGLGVASLIIGIVYLAGTAYFDHRGLQGTATAFVLAGIVAFTLGFDLLEDKFGQAGTGILIFLVGLLLAALGAAGGRRFTTWLGGLWVLGGIVTLLEDLIHDATPAGITLIVIGLAVIVGAHFAAKYLREPLETDPGPSLLPGQVSEPVA